MNSKILLAASLAIVVSAPALAKDEGTAKSDVKEKKVCRTEAITGSRVAKRRICMTQAEWDQTAENARKSVNDYTRRQGIGRETGSGMGANSGF